MTESQVLSFVISFVIVGFSIFCCQIFWAYRLSREDTDIERIKRDAFWMGLMTPGMICFLPHIIVIWLWKKLTDLAIDRGMRS